MALPAFNMRQLLEAGVHFGHQTHRWNPKMAPFIFGARNNIHILDLTQTVPMLHQALLKVSDTVANGGRVLFVGTKRQASEGDRRRRQALGPVLHQPSLARRHADQLEDDLAVDPPPAPARRHPRRSAGPHQEGSAEPHARARQAQPGARRHQGHGRPARPAVRDRHEQGRASPSRKRASSASRSSPSSTPTAIRTASTSRSRATTTPAAPSRSIAISSRAPRSTASSAASRRPASTSAPPKRRPPRTLPEAATFKGIDAAARRSRRPEAHHRHHARSSSRASTTPASSTSGRSPTSTPSRPGAPRPPAEAQGPDRDRDSWVAQAKKLVEADGRLNERLPASRRHGLRAAPAQPAGAD